MRGRHVPVQLSGPTAVAECRPPIEKMQREIAKGNAIPKCPLSRTTRRAGTGAQVAVATIAPLSKCVRSAARLWPLADLSRLDIAAVASRDCSAFSQMSV